MKPWAKLLLLGLLAAVVAELALRAPGLRGPHAAAVAEAAPPFELPDLGGRKVSLGSLKGRVVAVNFWASWCAPCREEIPALSRVWHQYRDRCFEMLGVAEESGTPEEVAEAARKFGIDYPVLLDEKGAAGDAFRIPGYPRTYLVDQGGVIRKVFEGAVEQEELEAAVVPLLGPAGACKG